MTNQWNFYMEKENYQHHSVDELAADPDFQRWVKQPTASDQEFWRDVINTYPHLQSDILAARQLVLIAHSNERTGQWAEERKQATHDRIMQSVNQPKRRGSYRFLWVPAAAASLLFMVACIWLLWPTSVGANQEVVYRTDFGETLLLTLPDSSRVTLNSNSELRLGASWETGADRKVTLSGEAYFEIEPKPATRAKFTVVTKDLEVNVLGTAFNVFSRERETSVTLDEGTVELSLNGQAEKLLTQPGEHVVYSARDQRLLEDEVVPGTQSSWKDGVLIFEDIPLEELGNIIEETFGLEAVFQDDGIRQKRITGTVPGAHDLDLLLETLEAALKIRIIQTDSLVRFENPAAE
ncbi:hypothetical protein CRP01_38935 [Flavilitoribacter nigricans DSM 23189 = NBRC 102662]|uniref:Uncharacterized protein n=2 Tax=Flavilitoribacter TaxID=2762562 RepID=A0A2D0MXW2_FLAN2|nr:hypothetical protein CRP01_38935 [Flavilitoribacter nigricans DSM 23189 = NBRC 102662]